MGGWSAAVRRRVRGGVGMVRIYATNPAVRRAAVLRMRRPPNLFQPFNDTADDRYPELFSYVRDRLGGRSGLRLLSFGCSTGQEVLTLRRYFPAAAITGIDISPANVADCRRAVAERPDPDIRFVCAGSTEDEPDDWYDAVFCMAVFRHGDLSASDADSCAHRLTFGAFEATVADIARCLKPGGYLVIEHSNFRLADTRSAEAFTCAARRPAIPADERTPLFGPDDRRLPDPQERAVVFQKVAPSVTASHPR